MSVENGATCVQWLGGKDGSPLPFNVYRGASVTTTQGWTNIAVVAKNGTGTNTWRDVGTPVAAPVYYRVTVAE